MIHKVLSNTQVMWIKFIKSIKEYNPKKKRKKSILSDDMIDDMLSNKELIQ